jgi:16S rRNA (guanine966-N2)-methyltransferase
MRIIGGELRGKKLAPLRGTAIRPTADRTREAVFNIISAKVPGANVLDLFAGTGAFGLEALSRGAARAVFVDNAAVALAAIEKNIAACRMQDRSRVIRWDIIRNLNCLGSVSQGFDLVFLDPPYNCNAVLPTLQNLVQSDALLAPGVTVIVEHAPSETITELPDGLALMDQRKYGKTLVSFLTIGQAVETRSFTPGSSPQEAGPAPVQTP